MLVLLLLVGCGRRYAASGLVVAVRPAVREVVISHKEVEGVMPAMVMPFRASGRALAAVYPGARVTFRMRAGGNAIDRLKLVSGALEGIKLDDGETLKLARPANAVAIGQLVPDFTLTDQSGAAVSLSSLRGKTVAVNFIYTRCPVPEMCPRLAASFAYLQKRFAGQELALLSVTLDPVYDTPEVLSEYGGKWRADRESWRLLTGSKEMIHPVAGLFGLVYWAEEDVIVHTSTTNIIDRKGRLVAQVDGSGYSVRQLADLVSNELDKR